MSFLITFGWTALIVAEAFLVVAAIVGLRVAWHEYRKWIFESSSRVIGQSILVTILVAVLAGTVAEALT